MLHCDLVAEMQRIGVVGTEPKAIRGRCVEVGGYGPAIGHEPEHVGWTRVVGESGDLEHVFPIRTAEGGAGVLEGSGVGGSCGVGICMI